MTALVIIGISLLLFLNYLYWRSLFAPAVVFCGVWLASMIVLVVSGDLFYPLHPTTLLIVLSGAVLFSLGSFLASGMRLRKPPPIIQRSSNTLINWGILAVVLVLPLIVRWLLAITAGSEQPLLMVLRVTLIGLQGSGIVYTIFGIAVQAATLLAMMAYYEGGKKRALIAILAAMALCVMTGTKGAPMWLVLALFYLHWLKTKQVGWKAVVVIAGVFIAIFSAVEIYVHAAGTSGGDPLLQNAALYSSGGVAALDSFIREPYVVPRSNPAYDTAKRISNRFFGTHLEVAEDNPEYVAIGPNGFRNNDYSIYTSWLEFGPAGMTCIMGLAGFLTTLLYRKALAGGRIAIFLYAVEINGLAFSPLSDYLISIFLIGFTVLFCWLVYYLPVRLRQFNAHLAYTAESDPRVRG